MNSLKEQLYAVPFDSYTTPGFCSGVDYYVDSLDNIKQFLNYRTKMISDSNHTDYYAEKLKNKISVYENTNNIETINVAYNNIPSLTDFELFFIGEVRRISKHFEWIHYNIWDCPYNMKCDGYIVNTIWGKFNGEYCRAYKISIKNLNYKTDFSPVWKKLRNGMWGQPYLIIPKEGFLVSQLYIIEKYFKDENEMQNDIKNFDFKNYDLTPFCNEIFGDG